jgi:phage regulator Rha-like protein
MLSMNSRKQKLVSQGVIERKIYLIRGQKVVLDSDLARLYQVPTKSVNLAVKRNVSRFPKDFMFRLTKKEAESLRFQIETSNGRGGRRYLPYAFTEHGVAMLSSVLSSDRAVQMNIAIIRAFIKLRDILATHKELAQRLENLELKYQEHDHELQAVFEAIRQLLSTPDPPKRNIGFAAGGRCILAAAK